MLEGYKAIADHLARYSGRHRTPETMRRWRRELGLPVVPVHHRVTVRTDVLERWWDALVARSQPLAQ